MVNSKQLQVGNDAEQYIADFLFKKGYMSIIIPKKMSGQPCDIVACKGGKEAWMIDAKHLSKNEASFSFDRIEPNQLTTMMIAKNFANMNNLGFVIKWDREESKLFFLSYEELVDLKKNGAKSVKIGLLRDFKEMIENECNN